VRQDERPGAKVVDLTEREPAYALLSAPGLTGSTPRCWPVADLVGVYGDYPPSV
jgi:hypothetical protein